MKSALEANATALGINVSSGSDYANANFAAKSRQSSVAQYVIDSKPLSGYTTEVQVKTAFNNGVAYEKAKLAFSDELAAGDTLNSADYLALKAAYESHVSYRGADPISTNALNAINKVLNAGTSQAALISAVNTKFGDGIAPASDEVNPYKINEVFNFINSLV